MDKETIILQLLMLGYSKYIIKNNWELKHLNDRWIHPSLHYISFPFRAYNMVFVDHPDGVFMRNITKINSIEELLCPK